MAALPPGQTPQDASEPDPDPTSRKVEPPLAPRPRWRKRRALARRLISFAVVVPVMAALALIFVANSRVLTVPAWVVERVETRLNAQAPEGDHVRLNALALGLSFRDRAFIVDVLDARLERDELSDRVHLPHLSVIFDLASLTQGRLQVRRLAVQGGTLRLTRAEDGRFDLGFGREAETIAQLPGTWAEVLAGLDVVLRHPLAAQLADVEAEALRVVVSDARTGRTLSLSEGTVTLRRAGGAAELVISADLNRERGGAAPGTFRLALSRTPGQGADLDLRLIGARSADLRMIFNIQTLDAAQSPATRDLMSVIRAGVDMWAVGEVREDGTLAPLEARIALENGSVPGWEGSEFDLAALEVRLEPQTRRLEVRRAEVRAPQGSVVATGQILAGDTLVDPLVVQLALSEIALDPEGLLPVPAAFDRGVLEGRVHLNPLRIDIGQAMIAAGPDVVRAGGVIWAPEPGALAATASITAERLATDTLKSLWPEALIPKTRRWIMENITDGEITDFSAALRKDPARARPEITGSFGFNGAEVRYLRHMPVAQASSGIGTFHDGRLSLRMEAASVSGGAWGRVDLSGTSFTIPDTRAEPAMGELDLVLAGPIPAVLWALDNKPISVLERANRPPDFVDGQAEVRGWLQVPLIKDVPLEEVSFAFDGTLRDVTSDVLVPGRAIAGAELALRVTPELVEVAGPVRLGDVPLRVTWRQPLPRVRDAAPAPGDLTGSLALSPETLVAFGVDPSVFSLAGETPATFEMSLGPERPQRLTLTSSLEGLSAAVPALRWRKAAASSGALRLEIDTGTPAAIPVVSLTAPGLAVEGSVQLRDGGALERADLTRLDVGDWLQATAEVRGQGAGRAPLVAITGGRADLRRADFDSPGAPSVSARGVAAEVTLRELVISEGIALNAVRAVISGEGGANGRFTALLNGDVPIAGTFVPSADGTAVRIRGNDAGATLASAGVFRTGNGGTFALRLVPRAGIGRYNGRLEIENLRVRDAPALASLLSAISVVGLLEQMGGEGLSFSTVEVDFELTPDAVRVVRSAALGPSMGLTADGTYSLVTRSLDMRGVISPFYLVNGLFGGLFAPRNEGLIGINYAVSGPATAPQVRVNPFSVLTPGVFRDIFRRPAPVPSQ